MEIYKFHALSCKSHKKPILVKIDMEMLQPSNAGLKATGDTKFMLLYIFDQFSKQNSSVYTNLPTGLTVL